MSSDSGPIACSSEAVERTPEHAGSPARDLTDRMHQHMHSQLLRQVLASWYFVQKREVKGTAR
jgi:hypothetical protein